MESFDLSDQKRIDDMEHLHKHPPHMFIPQQKFSYVNVNSSEFVIVTHQLPDEEPLTNLLKTKTSSEVLLIMCNFITAISTLHALDIVHGLLHHSSLFVSKSSGIVRLRGFASCRPHMTKRDELLPLCETLQYMASQIGADIMDVVRLIRVFENLPAAANKLNQMVASELRVQTHRLQSITLSEVRDLLLGEYPLISFPVHTHIPIHLIVSVCSAVKQTCQSGVPVFTYAASHAKYNTNGMGPHTEIVHKFFSAIVEYGLMRREVDEAYWPVDPRHTHTQKASLLFSTLSDRVPHISVYNSIGYMLVYALCMNIHVPVRLSRLCIRLIVSLVEEVLLIKNIISSHKHGLPKLLESKTTMLSEMNAGARTMVKILRSRGLSVDEIVEYLYNNQRHGDVLARDVVGNVEFDDSVDPAQRENFMTLIKTFDQQLSRKFFANVTGSAMFDVDNDTIGVSLLSAGASGIDVVYSVCNKRISITPCILSDYKLLTECILSDLVGSPIQMYNHE